MKSFYPIFCLLLPFTLMAQSKNYKVVYRHCVQIDTTKVLTDTSGLEAILTGNDISSNYNFGKQVTPAGAPQPQAPNTLEKAIADKQAGPVSFKVGISFDAIGNMVAWNKKNDSVFVREKMMNQYVVTREKRPEINWEISEEVRKIQNYNCLKATAEYRGRKYTAWFTPDLPIAEGPWKFKGLPGLVMSISDEDGQVKIYATQVEFPSAEPVPAFVANGKPVSLNEYFTFLNEEMNMQIKGVEALVSGQPGIQGSNQQTFNPKMRKRMYYRIEKRF